MEIITAVIKKMNNPLFFRLIDHAGKFFFPLENSKPKDYFNLRYRPVKL